MKNALIKRGFILLLGISFLMTACGPKEIPDDKMADIIHDVFLVNAYYTQFQSGKIKTDSVDIYGPVLEKYGYTVEDFRYSIERMTLKKSSRISELIDEATADIKKENDFFTYRQRMREKIDTLIGDYYQDTVYRRPDSTWVRNTRLKDSLTITIPVKKGNYTIQYNYLLEGRDREYLTMEYDQKDSLGKSAGNSSRQFSRQDGANKMNVSFVANFNARELEVLLVDYPSHAEKLAVRIDSVLITHIPPLEEKRPRFWKDLRDISDEEFTAYDFIPQDSSALYIVPPLRPDTARRTVL